MMPTLSMPASRHGRMDSGRCSSRLPLKQTTPRNCWIVLRSKSSTKVLHIRRAIVYNPRGTAGTPVATPHFYSASYTADLRAVINSLQQQYPRTPLVACGYSLGANILCRSATDSGTVLS